MTATIAMEIRVSAIIYIKICGVWGVYLDDSPYNYSQLSNTESNL